MATLAAFVLAMTANAPVDAAAEGHPRVGRASSSKARTSSNESETPSAPPGSRLYSSASPFNQAVPANPPIVPDSSQMIQGLVQAGQEKGFVLTVGSWTVSNFVANPQTPLANVALRKAPPNWGVAPDYLGFPPGWSDSLSRVIPDTMYGVPIPASARPDPSLDAHMTVLDPGTDCEYDFYGAHKTVNGWTAVWGNSTRIDGEGIYPHGMGTKASGFAGDAGLIWPNELKSGHIEHALLFAYPYTKGGGPVPPATSSDGLSNLVGAMSEGTRLQLDPSLNLNSLGLAPYQRTIAEALQAYGMILGDTGGAFGLFAVARNSYRTNPYKGILPAGAYPDLSDIPASRFRVIASPPQQEKPALKLEASGCGALG